jgi:hypothetical protein
MKDVFWTDCLLREGGLSGSRGETLARADSAESSLRGDPRGAFAELAASGEGFGPLRRPGEVSSRCGSAERDGGTGVSGTNVWGTSSVRVRVLFRWFAGCSSVGFFPVGAGGGTGALAF